MIPSARSSDAARQVVPANLSYSDASKGFLTDGDWWAGGFGLAHLGGSGYPSVVTMRGHDDFLCKTQGWHVFSFDGRGTWTDSYTKTDYGYGAYNAGLDENGQWLFGAGTHHRSRSQGFYVMGAVGGDRSNGLNTSEDIYFGGGPIFGDIDSDGVVDSAFGGNGKVWIFEGPAGKWTFLQNVSGGGAKFLDMNRDGYLDLVKGGQNGFIWFWNSTADQFVKAGDNVPKYDSSFDVSDVNHDGYPDALLNRYVKGFGRSVEVWLQDANGIFTNSSTGLPGGGNAWWMKLRFGDFNGDGETDVSGSMGSPGDLGIWLGDGGKTWTWTPFTPSGVASIVPSLDVMDIDNNGRDDFVFPTVIGDCTDGGGFRALTENTTASTLGARVREPWGGERWFPGSIRYLKWGAAMPPGEVCAGSATLDYSTTGPSGPWKTIEESVACAGERAWKVPNDPSKNVFIRVTVKGKSASAEGLSGAGTLPFEIIGGSGVPLRSAIVSPAGSETWAVGTIQQISWSVSGGQSPYTFDVEYSTSGSSGPWKQIASGVTKTDHTWTVPDDPTTSAVVRVLAKDSSSPSQSAIAVSKEFTIYRPSVPMQATLKADPTTLGPGGRSVLSLELKDAAGGGVEGATIVLSADKGGTVSPPAEKGGGVYEATLTAPNVLSKMTVTVSANASKPGFVDATASVQVEVSPFLPDLSIVDGALLVGANVPEGESATPRAKIANTGQSDAGEFVVRFLVDGKEFSSETVSGLAVSESRDVAAVWKATKGKHELKIVLDPDNAIKEADESNNQASATVEVRATPRGFEIPWWVFLLIAVVVAGLIAWAIASRRKKPCKWCNTRHADGAFCPGAGWR